MADRTISAEILPTANQANQAALALQRLGFRVLHIGTTISVQGPRSLWESTFNVSFKENRKTIISEIDREATYWSANTENLRIPDSLKNLVVEVMFAEPPQFY